MARGTTRRGKAKLTPLPRDVPLGTVIASRRFQVTGKGKRWAEVRIGAPEDLPDQDAYCPVQLIGLGDERVHPIFGVDTLQAVQLAIRFAAQLLEGYGDQLRWEREPAHRSLDLVFTRP